MADFAVPRLVVSKCIEFDSCRYDGSMIPSEFVRAIKPYIDFVPVCAEVEIGLGVPRPSMRIVASDEGPRLMQPTTGRDVTDDMNNFADDFLGNLRGIDGFILKYRSPSCGLKDIRVYSAIRNAPPSGKLPGFFGGEALRRFPDLAIEDEGRLRNLNIRHHFLTQIYALAGFREAVASGRSKSIVDFHTRNKLLLMAHNQREARIMGKIAANNDGLDFESQTHEYREHLGAALGRPPRSTSHINVLQHALGHFSDGLSRDERSFFLQSIDRYRNRKLQLASLLTVLRGWAVRFEDEYLKEQTYLQPYPEELVELCVDSQCEWRGEEVFQRRG